MRVLLRRELLLQFWLNNPICLSAARCSSAPRPHDEPDLYALQKSSAVPAPSVSHPPITDRRQQGHSRWLQFPCIDMYYVLSLMFLQIKQHSSCEAFRGERCGFFFPCVLVWIQTKWVLAWWQSSINVSRCALQTRWRGMPRAAFPVFLNFTCACYTFVRRWQRAELTVARAIMGAILWFAFETYSRVDIVPSSHGTHQCRCMIQHLPGICSHQPSAR